MWRGWRGDLKAALVGLAVLPALVYAVGGAVIAYEKAACDAACEANGEWFGRGMGAPDDLTAAP